MYAFDSSYSLRLFSTAEDIFREHAKARLALYWDRRAHQLAEMASKLLVLNGKIAFVELVIAGALVLRGVPEAELLAALREHELPNTAPSKPGAHGYEYLLNLSISAFTQERIAALRQEARGLEAARVALQSQTASGLWLNDLVAVETAYADYQRRLTSRHSEEAAPLTSRQALRKRKAAGVNATAKKKAKA